MKLLVISPCESDLSRLLAGSFAHCNRIMPSEMEGVDLGWYDAFAVLGGVEAEGLALLPQDRNALYAQCLLGKHVFGEYTKGIGQVSFLSAQGSRFERPVLMHAQDGIMGEQDAGTLFDEQSNDRMKVYKALNRERPILQYVKNPEGFYCLPADQTPAPNLADFALWLDEENLLVTSFRMAGFAKAKFAPRQAWTRLLCDIVTWLGGTCAPEDVHTVFDSAYTFAKGLPLQAVADRAAAWFQSANMFIHRGGRPYAVMEGLSSHVKADGTHLLSTEIRMDCVGETSHMFFLKALLEGDAQAEDTAMGLLRFPLDMQVTEPCPEWGMVRGNLSAWWNVSYQDDAARGFILPLLWRAFLSGDRQYLPRVESALDYLLKTTGSDGLRATRVDFYDMYSSEIYATGLHCAADSAASTGKWAWGGGITGITTMEQLQGLPAGTPSAHYNAYYMAALLFAYKLTGKQRYLQAGEKGMKTIMSFYPQTAREHSETQELCRLVMPLAMLYWASRKPEHKEWLYQVTHDLQRFAHISGGYMEWDTGYTATCARAVDTESAAFSSNGDPVCDLLYSVNWLPQAFALAYYITGDGWFKTLWESVLDFLMRVQIHSENLIIDGGWSRAVDMDAMEVYGVANDVGWSPWSIESGWTVAEIAAGIYLGLLEDRIMDKFQD